MGIKSFIEVLTNNALNLHMANTRNCIMVGLMLTALFLLVSTVTSILAIYGFENLLYTPGKILYLLGFLQALALIGVLAFDRRGWRKYPARQRFAWLTWFGFWTTSTGAILIVLGIEAFTVTMFAQGVLFTLVSVWFYVRSERRS